MAGVARVVEIMATLSMKNTAARGNEHAIRAQQMYHASMSPSGKLVMGPCSTWRQGSVTALASSTSSVPFGMRVHLGPRR
jgi:hypothetical protein